ncbi:hypothetical protein D3C72_1956940 [compost metagenome]
MVFVVAVGRLVAVRVVFTKRNDGVVGVVTVLLIQPRVDNPGDQRAITRTQ